MKLDSLSASLRPSAGTSEPGGSPYPCRVLRVEVRDGDGNTGVGESIARGDITGEHADSALAFVQRLRANWLHIQLSVAALRTWVEANAQAIDSSPAAWTAIELALLDLMARRQSLCLEDLLDLPPAAPVPRGTATLREGSTGQFDGLLTSFICAGYRDYKVTLSGTLHIDRGRVEALHAGRITGAHARAAAHRLWHSVEQADEYLWQLGFPWWAVEEPLAPGALADLRRLGQLRDLRIVLDESIQQAAQLEALRADPQRWLVVTHVAKLGGLLRTLEFVRRARELRIELVLTTARDDPISVRRAQACVGAQGGDIIRAHEGDLPGSGKSGDPDHVQRWLRHPGLDLDFNA